MGELNSIESRLGITAAKTLRRSLAILAGVVPGRSRDRCETAVVEGSDGEAEEAVIGHSFVFFF